MLRHLFFCCQKGRVQKALCHLCCMRVNKKETMRPCFKQVSGFAETSFLIGSKAAQRSCLCLLSAVDLLLEGRGHLSKHLLVNTAQGQVLRIAARTPSASAFGGCVLKHGRCPTTALGRLGMDETDFQKNNKVAPPSPTLTLLVAQCSASPPLQYDCLLCMSGNAVLMRTTLYTKLRRTASSVDIPT